MANPAPDPKTLDVRVRVGWVKGLNRLYFLYEAYDNYWDFSRADLHNDIFELVIDGDLSAHSATSGGTTITINMATGAPETEIGPASRIRFTDLSDEMKDVEIWLPHNERIELLELRCNATVEPGPAHTRPVWLHHGSSISHGSNATRPTGNPDLN